MRSIRSGWFYFEKEQPILCLPFSKHGDKGKVQVTMASHIEIEIMKDDQLS